MYRVIGSPIQSYITSGTNFVLHYVFSNSQTPLLCETETPKRPGNPLN
jgi:hypothetical protein